MKLLERFALVSLFCLLSFGRAFGQETPKGKVQGTVADPEFKRVVPTATVSVYDPRDSSIVNYTLTDANGVFKIGNLPISTDLYLIVSFVGYQNQKLDFNIGSNGELDIGVVNLSKTTNVLEEVVISGIPPVRMNGDTLEFNADAFKMDPNAVAEDLLKRLPGVVVWGDGVITVNGREISRLLVNGKLFFGGDTKIATQNIEKNAIEKVQVYQKETRGLDSISEINIVMKDQKSLSYFGRLLGGTGTGKSYQADANVNAFNKRTQASALFGKNNINQESDDIAVMLRNSTYKGNGISQEYATDFDKPGRTESMRGGFLLRRDFQDNVNEREKNGLNMNYLYNNAVQDVLEEGTTVTDFGDERTQQRLNQRNIHNDRKVNRLSGKYDLSKRNFGFSALGRLNTLAADRSRVGWDSVRSVGNSEPLSTRTLEQKTSEENTNAHIGLRLNHAKNRDAERRPPGDWSIDYSMTRTDNRAVAHNASSFASLTNPSADFSLLRRTPFSLQQTDHRIYGKWGDFWKALGGRAIDKFLYLSSALNYSDKKVADRFFDMDGMGTETLNTLLSYDRREKNLEWAPAVTYEKSYFKHLSGRFQKQGKLAVTAGYLLHTLKSRSDRDFQNFKRSFGRFNPVVSFDYSNVQLDEFRNTVMLKYQVSNVFPSVEQLFPVVDTTNVYSISFGNPALKPSEKHELSANFEHRKAGRKNPFSYNLGMVTGIIRNHFTYRMEYDRSGRSTITPVNLGGNRYATVRANLSRAVKLKQDQFEFKLNAYRTLSENPFFMVYTTEQEDLEKNISTSSGIDANSLFSRNDVVDLGVSYSFRSYTSKQRRRSNSIVNSRHALEGNLGLYFSKKLSLLSNFTHYIDKFYGADQNYSICNLKLSYRMLRQNNLELVLSGNDILNQNRHLTVRQNNNILSQDRTSSLGRFYMFSVAYYPRKFGKKTKDL